MKNILLLLLKFFILVVALITLVCLIRFPQTEGRAAGLDLVSIYIDPFIIYIYVASIPFFVALYNTFILLILQGKNQIFSSKSVNAARYIKYCCTALILFLAAAIYYIQVTAHGDDPAGPTMLGFIAILIFASTALVAKNYQKYLQKNQVKR